MDPPSSIRAAMGDDHEGDDDMEPVFIDEGDCEVALDLDEEDDAPMDSDDEIEGDPNAPIEDRDAEGTELVPPSEDAAAVVRAHRGSVYACAWSPTAADTFATGGGDDLAYLHRIAPDCAVTSTPLKAHTDTIASMAFNHDGSLLATGGLEGKASIWNVSTGELMKTLEGPGGGLEWVRWHPKGNVLLAGSEDFTAWMWNAENAELMQVFAGHSNSVLCGGFSPDGRHVVTGSCDGSLTNLGAPLRRVLHAVPGPPVPRRTGDLHRLPRLHAGTDADGQRGQHVQAGERGVRQGVGHTGGAYGDGGVRRAQRRLSVCGFRRDRRQVRGLGPQHAAAEDDADARQGGERAQVGPGHGVRVQVRSPTVVD